MEDALTSGLSQAELDAVLLSSDALLPENLFFLRSPWAAEIAMPPPRPPPPSATSTDLPQQRQASVRVPREPENLMASFMELLPRELFSLHHSVALTDGGEADARRARGFGGGVGDEEDDEEEVLPEQPDPQAALDRLEKVVVGPPGEQQGDGCCSICLEELEEGGEARAMGCSHRYHEACIFEWLKRKRSCPLCRYQMMPVV